MMGCLKLFLRYPYIVLTAVFIFGVTTLILLHFFAKLPDFHDPKLGFESCGSDISGRMTAFELLMDKTVVDPAFLVTISSIHANDSHNNHSIIDSFDDDDDDEEEVDEDYSANKSLEPDTFFCDVPRSAYARIVFKSTTVENSLFDANRLKSMCQIEEEMIRVQQEFRNVCIRTLNGRECCRSWSLGNYVALLTKRSSCHEINDDNVRSVLRLVQKCRSAFEKYSDVPECWSDDEDDDDEDGAYRRRCKKIPKRCKRYGAIYHIFYHLTDENFSNGDLYPTVRYATTFLPVAAGIGAKSLYRQIEKSRLTDGLTSVVAVNFGIKQDLFDEYIITDTVWFGMGMACIVLLVSLYTASIFITIMTILLIFLSLEISFFVYTLIFQINFFPFMNMLIAIILVGIGVDDMFIYCRIWSLGKMQKNSMTFAKLVVSTFRHATLSMAVTSLTTAAAFYSSYVSNVTVLSCFAIFAGTAVLINFLLMVVWMPAVIIVHEKWCASCCPFLSSSQTGFCCRFFCFICEIYLNVVGWFSKFFIHILPYIIIKLRYLWLIVFGMLGIGGAIVVLAYPKLKLPRTNEFQLFAHEHLFEVYDLKIKNLFSFEKNNDPQMPITIVWGVKPIDTSNKLDPTDKSELLYDDEFDISTPEAQTFLLGFCQRLRSTKYYFHEPGFQWTNCFIENFNRFMNRSCSWIGGISLRPCCDLSTFPMSKELFDNCIKEYIPNLSMSTSLFPSNPNAGLRFRRGSDRPVSLVVEMTSNEQFSLNYTQMTDFFTFMDDFVKEEVKYAPREMRNGWFISYLSFYDLQRSIANGTPLAIGVSLSIASVVAFLTTLNILVTVYSMITISGAIFVTVAILVLIGWELNVLESVTISVAVGLSIDYTLHYGMAFRLSPVQSRHLRVTNALQNVASPVAMAATTTFLVGTCLMPSTVLAYRQLGVFLMIVIFVSWMYATFFFQSLLLLIGPKGNFGQLSWPSISSCISSSYGEDHIDKTVYTMSDSTLSSNSTTNQTQELEQLAEQNLRHLSSRRQSMDSRNKDDEYEGSTESPFPLSNHKNAEDERIVNRSNEDEKQKDSSASMLQTSAE